MNDGKTKYVGQWIAKGDEDYLGAERLLQHDPLAVSGLIGFHCQQAIEKYLKSYLVFCDYDFKRTHNLEELRDNCAEYDSDFLKLDFLDLTDYAVSFRYPDDDYAPEMSEIENYFSFVQQTKEMVINKIKLK
jgi:HEPN domain-containing protein